MLASLGHIGRLGRAAFVLAREGVFSGIDPAVVPVAARPPLALARMVARRRTAAQGARLGVAMGRLGPSYVKLGQFLATRPDVVGPAAVRDLEGLQDRVPPFPREVAVAIVEAAFDRPLAQTFSHFGEPVAAASVAQVHKARLTAERGGGEVAVKVMRPGVDRRFKRDLGDLYFAARTAERLAPDARRLKIVEVIDALARSVTMEMDFRIEAAAASEFAENVRDDPDFRIPAIDWTLTAKDVLTLEWVDGTSLTDVALLRERGYDLPALGRTVLQSFLRHAMRDGLFHADMHQGNLFMDAEGRLTAVDFGIMGRLGRRERRFLAEILYGFIRRDYLRVAEVHFQAGYVPDKHRVEDFAQAIRAIGEPIHARPRRRDLHGEAVDAAVRDHGLVRHAHPRPNSLCCRRPWWWWRAWPARWIPGSTCGPRPNPWCGPGSRATSAPPARSRTSPPRSAAWSAAPWRCPTSCSGPRRSWARWRRRWRTAGRWPPPRWSGRPQPNQGV